MESISEQFKKVQSLNPESIEKCVEIANSYAIGFSVFCMQEYMDDLESNKPSRIETMGDILERYNSLNK